MATDEPGRWDDVLRSAARLQQLVPDAVLVGSLDGIETGIRQLIRTRPLEVEEVTLGGGATVRIPTLAEMLRVKAWLVVTRNATRDYLDVVALADRVGAGAPVVLWSMDDYYDAVATPTRAPVTTQVARQLAEPLPYDLDAVELLEYRGLDARWQDWPAVVAACGDLAVAVLGAAADSDPEGR